MGDGDDASGERRLLGEERPTAIGLVASETGIVRVDLAPDRVGGFGLVERRCGTDIATDGESVVVGTDEDVLVDTAGTGEFVPVGFGPASAVGIGDGRVLAAGPDGRVGRLPLGAAGDAEWESVGSVAEPRRFDGRVLATGAGVVRIEDGPVELGSSDAFDVARGSVDGEAVLFAATTDGLLRREGDDWLREFDTPVRRVRVRGGEAHAVRKDGGLMRREAGSWTRVALPEGTAAVDVASGESLYVVTRDGELLAAPGPAGASDGLGGWRSQPLGVRRATGFVLLGD